MNEKMRTAINFIKILCEFYEAKVNKKGKNT